MIYFIYMDTTVMMAWSRGVRRGEGSLWDTCIYFYGTGLHLETEALSDGVKQGISPVQYAALVSGR